MAIALTCHHCGAALRVKDELAGRRGKCPGCQGSLVVPTLQSPPPTEPLKDGPPPQAASAPAGSRAALPANQLADQILQAFEGNVSRVRAPLAYQAGVLLVVGVMLLLPAIYLALIAAVGYGMYWHAVHDLGIVTAVRGRAAIAALVLYLGPLVAGAILIVFMIKPLFSRPQKQHKIRSLTRNAEPLLFAFLDRICAAVGAPQPARVDLDMEVNASASFRRGWLSFLGRDLVLTVGLPLVAGLNLRQFAGVLAHEFGHFSQGAGMRLTYIIRSINHWFMRVVYERDHWDVQVRVWAEENDLRISWIFWLALWFIWLTRKILWGLMMVGHFVGSYMLRQMEFAADRYEARLAGSNTFAQTARQLRLLGLATHKAHVDLGAFYREGRLVDNLPKLIVNHLSQVPPQVVRKIDEQVAQSQTGWLDTHPADKDRIASAQREATAGIFRLELPATVLFSNFESQATTATLEFYRGIFGPKVKADDLHSVDKLLQHQHTQQADLQALRCYFQNRVSPQRPLLLPVLKAGPPANAAAAVGQLKVLREQLLA